MCHVDIYYNKDIETKCPPDGVYAWTWTNPGSARSDQYMTFCPLFFISPTLATDVQKGQNNKDAIKFMDGFDTNTAATFFHESFHMENTVGNPPIWDNPDGVAEAGVYGSGPTADLAEKRNTAATMLVAECYTMAGLAIYYRDTLGLSYFPKPKGQTGGTFIRKKLANPGATQGASDPNDPNSQPSDDWIPLS
jgi:hypothetical protein